MYTPFAFLRFVAKAALNALGGGMMGELLVEVLPDVAQDVWQRWGSQQTPEAVREEIQQLAQAPAGQVRQEVQAIVAETAAGQPLAVRQQLTAYLEQVPCTIRRSLRRPADPSGKTVPGSLVLSQASDLIPFLPTRLPHFEPGSRPTGIGDWELVELLGMGGFGEVWKACNPHVPSAAPVALKFCMDPTAAKLLRHEAVILDRVMSQGRHPGIVELRHTYLGAEPPCLEYEYVSGGDLGSLLLAWHRVPTVPTPGKPHPIIARAAGLIRDLAEIIAFAHRLEPPIVHRDLKPANILLQKGDEGRVSLRVADFGIGALATRNVVSTSSRGTTRGQLLATALRGSHTPLYASPQQSRGDPPDPRDDVHALGVLWYQALVGDLTTGRPGGARWTRRLSEQGMSDELVDLLTSCIEDDPRDRPASAVELYDRLCALSPPTPARGVPARGEPALALEVPAAQAGEGPGAALPATPRALPTIIVSRLGRGHFASVAEAARQAGAGSRILVQPGLYPDGVVLDRPLEIFGDGEAADIILQSQDGPCLTMQTDYALVRGVTLRCRPGPGGKPGYAVEVLQGQLVLDGCSISSRSLACVGVHGPLADPLLRRCRIHDGASAGVFFYDGASGTVEACEIDTCTHAGIAICQMSSPVVRDCRIHHGKQVGIHVYEAGRGTIEDCALHGHVLNGLEIKDEGAPTVRRCTVQDGVLIWNGGRGTLEECDLSGNTAPELAVSTEATPTVRCCRIHDSKHSGVLVYQQGGGVFEDCDILDNALNGVEVNDGSRPTFRHCRIRRSRYRGIYVHGGSSPTVEYCDLSDNHQGPWYIAPDSSVRRVGNRE